MNQSAASHDGFTVLELLVVLAIIGILAVISLPHLRGINQSNIIAAANRQLLDDLALARQRAISGRSIVHVVFVPPSLETMQFAPADQTVAEQLRVGAYTTYAFFAERTVGDQPGRPTSRYLGPWRHVPDGVFIAEREFEILSPSDWSARDPTNRPFLYLPLPFPSTSGYTNPLPHIAFNPQGGLVSYDGRDEVIELARGTVFASRDPSGSLSYFEVRENPPGNSITNFNRIRIDALTGRAKVERVEIQ